MVKWYSIDGYLGIYEASSDGNIRNNKGHVLKPWIINSGYHVVSLYRDKVKSTFLVHRLVLESVTSINLNSYEVNHIDGDKLNNNILNLERVTSKENKKHAKERRQRMIIKTLLFLKKKYIKIMHSE